MAYVVCEPCRDCKYTDCVAVCRWSASIKMKHALHRSERVHRLRCVPPRMSGRGDLSEAEVPRQ